MGVQLIDGPGDFETYKYCFGPFRTGSWMLRIVTVATLDEYVGRLSHYVKLYPGMWHIIYAADIQARKYHLERIRREQAYRHEVAVLRNQFTDYEPDRPWKRSAQGHGVLAAQHRRHMLRPHSEAQDHHRWSPHREFH